MSTEPRRIKRIVRRAENPFPEVPIGQSRRGAIATQEVHTFALSRLRVVEGCITLPQLARARGIQAQLARLWIKAAGIKKPAGGRWVWAEDSKALPRVRKALGLKP